MTRPPRRTTAPGVLCLALLACLATAGCGAGEPESRPAIGVEWDLSGAHTRAQVTWPREALDLYTAQLKPVESARIELPEGKLLDIPSGLNDIILYRRALGPDPLPGPEGEILEKMEVYSEPMSVQDAYRSDDPLGGKGGPFVGLELLYSYDQQRPWAVMVQLYWPEPRDA